MSAVRFDSYDDRGVAEYEASLDRGEQYEMAIQDALMNAKCIEDLSGSFLDHEYKSFHLLIAAEDFVEAGFAYQKFCRNALERDCKTAADVLNYIEVCND